MEGLKFSFILETEYREHLRREILSKKKGKSRKLTNKDKEFIEQKCLMAAFKPTVQTVPLAALAPAPQEQTPSPQQQQEQPQQEVPSPQMDQEADLPPANMSPAPEGLPQ